MVKALGILGFGSFGRFAAQHLAQHFDVTVADRQLEKFADAPFRFGSVAEAAGCDIVVLAVPVQEMESLLDEIRDCLRPASLVVEVASVKQRPAEILSAGLPSGVRFLGLHPMFGPQSGKDGIRGLKVVVCLPKHSPRCASDVQARSITAFLRSLDLEVLTMTAAEHDHEMAYIQGLTHWIAKALREIHLPDLKLATPAYRHLLSIEEILREDSLELFMTIQRENGFAETARAELTHRLREIEDLIEGRAQEASPSTFGLVDRLD